MSYPRTGYARPVTRVIRMARATELACILAFAIVPLRADAQGVDLSALQQSGEVGAVYSAPVSDAGTQIVLGETTGREALQIDLMRADVEILPSDGATAVVIVATDSEIEGGSRIRFEIGRSGNVWVLKDLFPEGGRHSGLRDCSPPPGERGDVFATNEKLLVTVRVPRAMAVETLVRSGTVIDQRKQAD